MIRSAPVAVIAGLAFRVLPTSVASAAPRNCGKITRPATTYRVIAIRGVSCKTAKRVAARDAAGIAPAPWHCRVGFGQKYRGKEIGSKCGHGGRGPVLKRRHAFVTVILANPG